MPPPNPMRGILALMPVIANHFFEGLAIRIVDFCRNGW
jgi:hypothetical protein